MSKPPRPHAGFYFCDGQAYSLTVQQLLARYDNLATSRTQITSDEEGITYEVDGAAITVPHTSEVYEHLQRQLSNGLVHCWYQRHPGESLLRNMDSDGDAIIEEFGRDEFQTARMKAIMHDEQHHAYLATLPTTLPPQPPKLKIVK